MSNSLRVTSGSRLRDSSLNLFVGSDGRIPVSSSVNSGFEFDDETGKFVVAEVRDVVAIGDGPNEGGPVALEVVVFEERDSDAFLHSNAGHRVVANVVELERDLVVEPSSKDASVAYDALVILEKQHAVPCVRHHLDVGGFVAEIVHHGGLVGAESLSAAAVVWVHAVGVFAQGQSHALSNHEGGDSIVPLVVLAFPLLAVLEGEARALVAGSLPENRLSGRCVLGLNAQG